MGAIDACGVGTVYRRFPLLDELIPACGEITMENVALPHPEGVSSLFDGSDGSAERIERLVSEAFAIYEQGSPRSSMRPSSRSDSRLWIARWFAP